MELKVKLMREGARVPERGTPEAAGADLYACLDETLTVAPHTTVMVPTGIAIELPPLHAGLVFARSGLATKRDLAPANKVGLIDPDYRGEVFVSLHNHGETAQTVEPGERVAQLVVMPYVVPELTLADELSDTERGAGGFGSTGTK